MAMKFRAVFDIKEGKSDKKINEIVFENIEKPNLSTKEENVDPNKWRFHQPEFQEFETKLKKESQLHTKSVFSF
jgi:hypothetical protein